MFNTCLPVIKKVSDSYTVIQRVKCRERVSCGTKVHNNKHAHPKRKEDEINMSKKESSSELKTSPVSGQKRHTRTSAKGTWKQETNERKQEMGLRNQLLREQECPQLESYVSTNVLWIHKSATMQRTATPRTGFEAPHPLLFRTSSPTDCFISMSRATCGFYYVWKRCLPSAFLFPQPVSS